MLRKIFSSENQRTNTVKKNIFGSLFVKGCSILISLLVVPLTIGYVSSELYGIWLTLASIIHWVHYMDVGFTLGLKNKLAEALANKDYDRGKSLVSTTYFLMVVIFVPVCILLLYLVPHIDWARLLNVNPMYSSDIVETISVLVILISVQMIINVFSTVVAAYQKVALSSSFAVIGQAISLIVIIVLKQFCNPQLVYLAFAFTLMPILVTILFSFAYYRYKFAAVSPSLKWIRLKFVKDLWSLGAKFFIIQIQVIVLYQTTNILISNIEGPDAVTEYNIAYKLLNVIIMICTLILSPLWPAFTDAYTKNDFTWMNKIYNKISRFYIVLIFTVICIVLLSPYIIQVWIGNEVKVSYILTACIGLYTILHSWSQMQVLLINGIGAVKLQTYVTMIGLVLHIPLSLFLGRQIGWGSVGVVISMSVIAIIYSTFFTIQIRKILSQKAKGIWIK